MSEADIDKGGEKRWRLLYRRTRAKIDANRKEAAILGAMAMAGLVAFAFVILGLSQVTWNNRSDRRPPAVIASVPDQPISPPDTEDEAFVSPLSPRALSKPGVFRRADILRPPFDMVDAQNFSAQDRRISLADIETPPLNAACKNTDGTLWPCGIYARATLYTIIRTETLACLEKRSDTLPPSPPAAPLMRCKMQSGRDVATELIRVGFARPFGLVGQEAAKALAEAQGEKRGMWRNNWNVVQPR
jgi:endonuclease YncB( thermonuclease family)